MNGSCAVSVRSGFSFLLSLLFCLVLPPLIQAAEPAKPIVSADLVFEEQGGEVAIEAEHFFKQSLSDVRAWYLTSKNETPDLKPDADPSHIAGASGGAYLEILPDTRKNHGEKLIKGENFSNVPGKLAILHYKVHFNTPGKYYVWVRTHSTGTEDNGVHVGLNGTWPASGQRMQWTAKRHWAWGSKQRTEKVHGGVKGLLFLTIENPGEHEIAFSMREDGFEFDKFIMTTDAKFSVAGTGPISRTKSGSLPKPFPFVDAPPSPHPAAPKTATPNKETSTVPIKPRSTPAGMYLGDFTERKQSYIDDDKWFAVNPASHKFSQVSGTWPYRSGRFDLILHAVGEDDGQSTYDLRIDGKAVGSFLCPLADQTTAEGPRFTKRFANIPVSESAKIEIRASVGSDNDEDFSRARWSKLLILGADKKAPGPRLRGKPFKEVSAGSNPPSKPTKSATASAPTKPVFSGALFGERGTDGDGSVTISGEQKRWHKTTLTLDGPFAHEKDNTPNPFTDHQFDVVFKHASGTPRYTVPGYFAADGDAGNSGAESGVKWRAHLAADKPGVWRYSTSFKTNGVANPRYAASGRITIAPIDKSATGRDNRLKGRLQYVGKHHLRFAGNGEYFLKAGADAPETFLAYTEFDNTSTRKPGKGILKNWAPHVRDWQAGDPTWNSPEGKRRGKGMIGAVNYLSGKGCNVFSFLTYNAGGDGDNVWPFIDRDDKMHYDCSKLDQWGIVFDHATARGMYLHFKLQETENDDRVPTSLDGGELGPQRKLYLREIIARFGHNLALNWNLGEENTQTLAQQRAMADFIAETDPYDHLIVIHTYPKDHQKVYGPLIKGSAVRGASLQNSNVANCHRDTLRWVRQSAEADNPWVVSFDEPGTAGEGIPADPGYPGMPDNFNNPSIDQTRKQALWGTLMAGGGGVEYYFGYKLPQNDLVCEDWRSRDRTWDYCRIALDFFREHKIPFHEMTTDNALVGNPENDNRRFCFAKKNEIYLVYLANGGASELDLSGVEGTFDVHWFNPREGGALVRGGVARVQGGGKRALGSAELKQDWLGLVRRAD